MLDIDLNKVYNNNIIDILVYNSENEKWEKVNKLLQD